jgi:four helix bundle protein
MAGYRELIVWQRAMQLLPAAYEIARQLPIEERYALAAQLRRAAVSVPANIAEGQARQYRREFIQALMIARGSLAELDTLLLVAVVLGYSSAERIRPAQRLLVSTRQLLDRLIHHLRSKSDAPTRRQGGVGQRTAPNGKRTTTLS